MTLWLIRAKRGEHERQFFQESRIYLMVAQQLNAARRLRVFEQDMRVNDWVVVPRHISQSVAIGVVRGEYEYHSCQNELFRYSRVVEWVEAELPLSVIDEDLIASFRSAPTCSRIRQPLAEERIRSLIAEHSIKTSATRRSYPNGSSWRVADQSKPEQKTGSSFLRRKLRERDILDYLALTSTCFTLAKLIASIWKDTDGKSTAGYIILLAELGLLAFLELRAGTGNFLTLPNSVTVPLILTSFGVTVLISTPGKLFLTLIATTVGTSFVLLFALVHKYRKGKLGFDQGTLIAFIIGGLFVGCENSLSFFWLVPIMATIYYLPQVFMGRMPYKSVVPIIPFVVMAAIISKMPISHDMMLKYRKFVVHDEITAINQFILESKRQGQSTDRLAMIASSAYARQSPGLVWTFCGTNLFKERFAVRDINTDLVFIVSVQKKPYKVIDIRHSTCPCEL